ncbi:TniB family NTP-binding protein [Spirosoma arcticum]
MNHLQPESQQMLNADVASRIEFIRQGCLLRYPVAERTIERLIYIIEQPDSHRMIGTLLHGPSNNGKTTILQYIVKRYGQVQNPDTGECSQAVVYVSAPINCDERLFLLLILEAINCPAGHKNRNDLFIQVVHVLRHLEIKLLIVDEFQQLLDGTPRQQRTLLTTIKMLSDMVRVPIVGAGLDTAKNAINYDPQLFNRLRPRPLPLWTTSPEGLDDYRSLLKTFESWLPLRQPSNLSNPVMAKKLNELTRGLLGELAELLKIAGTYAVESGEERITSALLDEIVKVRQLYQPPEASLY